jgi:glycosyltransferase involved in cell wall biosynthesis
VPARSTQKLRIAVVVDQFPELTETFISGEAQQLRVLGHAVHVESSRHAPHPDAKAGEGLEVAYLCDDPRDERLKAMAWLALRHPLRCLRDLRARRRWSAEEEPRLLRRLAPAARRMHRHRAQHVHAHFATGAALDALRLGALLGLPYSVATHGYDIFQLPRNLREKHERATFAVTDCDYSAAHLRGVAPGAADRIHRIVLGVDGDRFRRARPYPGGRTVVAVARLTEKKGLEYLIDAIALLAERGAAPDRLLVAGEGPLRDALTERIAGHGLTGVVELLGARTPAQTRELLERADVLAMPCVVAADGDRDTMPVVVKEALAMELPVLATAEVGLPEVVREGWGRLVPPRDAPAIADALQELLALPAEERARMGAAGRAFVLEECSLERETEKLVALIGGGAR